MLSLEDLYIENSPCTCDRNIICNIWFIYQLNKYLKKFTVKGNYEITFKIVLETLE